MPEELVYMAEERGYIAEERNYMAEERGYMEEECGYMKHRMSDFGKGCGKKNCFFKYFLFSISRL